MRVAVMHCAGIGRVKNRPEPAILAPIRIERVLASRTEGA
jgi:hypothetical protein